MLDEIGFVDLLKLVVILVMVHLGLLVAAFIS